MNDEIPKTLYAIVDELRSIASNLNAFARNIYEVERAHQIMELAARLAAVADARPAEIVRSELVGGSWQHFSPVIGVEAFVLNDGCIYEEGVCHTIHLPKQYGGPICMDNYRYSYYRTDGSDIAPDEQSLMLQNEKDYAEWTWYKFSCGFSTSKQGYTFGPCGLCAIDDFMRAGLTAIKIAGREAPLERKIKSIELVKSVRDKIKRGATKSDILNYATQVRTRPDLCESGYMCYYPEVLQIT